MAARTRKARTDEAPVCPHCDGMGLIVEDGGTVRRCECGAWESLELSHAMERARIPRRFQGKSLADFKADKKDAVRAEIRKIATAFAQSFSPEEDRGLLLQGVTGCGKTHVAVAVLQEVLKRGYTGMYCNVTDFLARLRQSYGAGQGDVEGDILAEMASVDLLVLDDLGAEAATEWVRDRLYLVVNRRYENARAAIVTTNCDEAELSERIGERIVSRLREMCERVNFPEEDYRRVTMR